jgi:hypothetical protein
MYSYGNTVNKMKNFFSHPRLPKNLRFSGRSIPPSSDPEEISVPRIAFRVLPAVVWTQKKIFENVKNGKILSILFFGDQ